MAWSFSTQSSRKTGWSNRISRIFCQNGLPHPSTSLHHLGSCGAERFRQGTPQDYQPWRHPSSSWCQSFQSDKTKAVCLDSGRSNGSAARSDSAAAASGCTLLSYLYSSCSRIAAELAARVSCKATGAGGSASSAAHAAKSNLVSGDGAGKSAKGGRSPSHRKPHSSQKDDRASGSPDKLLIHRAKELMDLGLQAMDQAHFVRALDLFNDGLKLNTADKKLNTRLHHNKGCALVELKQYALAIVECCKVTDLDKDMWHPYIVRHLAWRHVGLYTKAAEDLVVAQAKGGPCKQLFIRDVAKADSLQYGSLLGLGNSGKPLQKRDVRIAYRGLMRECHPDKAPNDQRHEHQRDVAHMLAQHLNFARDKLIASL